MEWAAVGGYEPKGRWRVMAPFEGQAAAKEFLMAHEGERLRCAFCGAIGIMGASIASRARVLDGASTITTYSDGRAHTSVHAVCANETLCESRRFRS